jgi:DNA polymerase-3 subunit chi
MAHVNVIFIELPTDNKLKYICDISEILFNSGEHLLIHSKDEKNSKNLDSLLWTWKEESFIPHVISTSANLIHDEPVIISDQLYPGKEEWSLILLDPCPPDSISYYKNIIDFAEVYDESKKIQSRERYKQFKDNGIYNLSFMKISNFLQQKI